MSELRAKVIFHNGFLISPTVETTNRNLHERLWDVVKIGVSPARGAVLLTAKSLAAGDPVSLTNTPLRTTFGGTLASCQSPEFWPGFGEAEQAGVFWVDVEGPSVSFWGGVGFEGTPEYTRAIPQRRDFEEFTNGLAQPGS